MSSTEATYCSLLGKLMQQDSAPLVNAYAAIEDLLKDIQKYVKVWLQYQNLWDMESVWACGDTLWQGMLYMFVHVIVIVL